MTSVRAKQDIFIVETSVQALIQQRGRKRSKEIHPED
jgi:hypothetical protein